MEWLRRRVFEVAGCPSEHLKLLYQGRELPDSTVLDSFTENPACVTLTMKVDYSSPHVTWCACASSDYRAC